MSFSVINLPALPAPKIIDQFSPETIFEQRKARLAELAPHLAPALELESEGLVQLLQEDAYREYLLRAAVQDAGKGNLLAFAQGAVLDHLAAFFGVERQVVVEADPTATPPIEQVLEDDERLRTRTQLAPEGYTSAGSVGAYTFWALSASPLVKSVKVLPDTPPGEVHVAVLSNQGNGTADAALLGAVVATLSAEHVRPLTDHVVVLSADIVTYQIVAELVFFDGPDSAVVMAAAQKAIAAYTARQHALGHDVTLSGIFAALHLEGVQKVDLQSPAAELVIQPGQAAFCTDITLTDGGRNV